MHFKKQDLKEMILWHDVRQVTTHIFAHKLLIFYQNSSLEVTVPTAKEEGSIIFD